MDDYVDDFLVETYGYDTTDGFVVSDSNSILDGSDLGSDSGTDINAFIREAERTTERARRLHTQLDSHLDQLINNETNDGKDCLSMDNRES